MAPGKGILDEEESMSIYEQYVAGVEQLPTTYQPGYTEYKRVSRVELEIWSHKKQLQELRKVGVEVNSSDEALKLFVRPDEETYPQTFAQMTLPDGRVFSVLNPYHAIFSPGLLSRQYIS